MLAGIAIFLLGMNMLEEGLRHLIGRPFKLFLKKNTSNKFTAILGGTLVTGLVQSSTLVNLIVIAFVGTGMIQISNALAIMLGANLGTTMNSWILATIGFGFNIENFALPVAGISGILMMLVRKGSQWYYYCSLALGFSFLFVGLGFIKTGMEQGIQQMDLQLLNDQPVFIFLLFGFFITAVIQSSSATIALCLTALHADAISLLSASAIVLGSESGTTIKLILASFKGSASKKRVAAGNVIINITCSVVLFFFLTPLNELITGGLGIQSPLIALVTFQTLVNLISIVLFFPFLGKFSNYLSKRFGHKEAPALLTAHISELDTDLGLDALGKESRKFLVQVVHFIANAFDAGSMIPVSQKYPRFDNERLNEEYEGIKTFYGEIHKYAIHLQNASLVESESLRLNQLVSSVRNGMYAAKNIRDILHDIEQLRKSSNDVKFEFYESNKVKTKAFCMKIAGLLQRNGNEGIFDDITSSYKILREEYTQSLRILYKTGVTKQLSEEEISTLINFNREMFTAFKSLIFVVKDFLLNPLEAKFFDDLPGFIR